jgi:hypothetical protein
MIEPGGLDEVIADLAGFTNDPHGFVLYSFPWGEAGTELENEPGPEDWQIRLMNSIRDKLLAGMEFGEAVASAIREARASGHGVGKSCVVSWIILWAMATYEDCRGIVTANTEKQLSTKTRAELAKWHRLFIGRDMFHLSATALFSTDKSHEMTWRIDLIPWSENNPEAFAGLHNAGKRIIVIFDEASTIADVIWEVVEGAMTDAKTQIIWLVFGNPTRNTGRFKDCFSPRSRWGTEQIDARKVRRANHAQHQEWIDDYGEDSDFVRVRVRGVFPRAGSMQFIPSDAVDQACIRDALAHLHDPLVLGVDVARFGDDASVIYIRKGRDGRTHPPQVFRGLDTMSLAGKVTDVASIYRADAIFVDGGGVGGGVVDRLRQLRVPCFDIQFGSKPDGRWAEEDSGILYSNKRAEIWGAMKAWLIAGGAIPDDKDLKAELIGPEYGFNIKNEIQLESKADMKKRGQASPDIADALALTFAYPVMASASAGRIGAEQTPLVEHEYDPFSKEAA